MNCFKIIIFSLFFITLSASAQYGNNSYTNRRLDNGMPNTQQSPAKPTAQEIEKYRAERVDAYMLKLKTALTLDELQYIAIKNEITTCSKNIDIVMKSDYSDEDKSNQVKALQETNDKTILSYLNTAQKEKFMALKVEKNLKKEDKKKKKGKDKEPEQN